MLGYVAQNRLSGQEAAIQWSEVEEYRARGYRLIDVRTAEEYAAGYIPGAENLPIDTLRTNISALPDGPLVIYCQVGVRGHVATSLLAGRGDDVVNLDGGYATWSTSPAANNFNHQEILIGIGE